MPNLRVFGVVGLTRIKVTVQSYLILGVKLAANDALGPLAVLRLVLLSDLFRNNLPNAVCFLRARMVYFTNFTCEEIEDQIFFCRLPHALVSD